MGKIKKTSKFACKFGKHLNKMAGDARHDPNNSMKMGIVNNKITDIWGYDTENNRRRERGGKAMPAQDCTTTCCNMKTPEIIEYIDKNCPNAEWCQCWIQICDDVYETHGHGRPTEEGMKIVDDYARDLFKKLTKKG